MATPPSYAAFISYRHTAADREVARWLHGALESYRLPAALLRTGLPARLGRVFRNEEELAASPDLSERIQLALQSSQALVVICSPNTPASRWVDAEIERFVALGRRDRLFAVLMEGEPAQSFPAALLATGQEPLAADLRPGSEASPRAQRRLALLKLVAGLLDLNFDALRQRDEERRRRRLALTAVAASALALLLGGLGIVALTQWQRAEAELRQSQARRLAVLGQLALAESRRGPGCAVCADVHRAVLLALESLRLQPTVEADAVLREALWDLPGTTLPVGDTAGDEPPAPGIDDEGRLRLQHDAIATAAGAAGDDLLARSADGGLRALRWEADADAAHPQARQGVALVDAQGRRLHHLPHEWAVAQARFSADGQWLTTVTGLVSADSAEPSATALPGSTLRVWETASGALRTEVSFAATGGLRQTAFAPSGQWAATVVGEPGAEAGGPGTQRMLAWPLPLSGCGPPPAPRWPATCRRRNGSATRCPAPGVRPVRASPRRRNERSAWSERRRGYLSVTP